MPTRWRWVRGSASGSISWALRPSSRKAVSSIGGPPSDGRDRSAPARRSHDRPLDQSGCWRSAVRGFAAENLGLACIAVAFDLTAHRASVLSLTEESRGSSVECDVGSHVATPQDFRDGLKSGKRSHKGSIHDRAGHSCDVSLFASVGSGAPAGDRRRYGTRARKADLAGASFDARPLSREGIC